MYDFIDTTEVSEGVALPSEALQINGEYIENLIPGYRTLQVEGREALSPEIASFETGIRDGSTMQGKRYPARTITVTYQLITKSNEDFRAAYNKLAGILEVKDAQLIFNDETDKYFVGTPSKIGEVEPGLNSVVGEFEITCFDPFKYSVAEYEAAADLEESSVVIDYKGTYKAFPTLEASFFNEEEASADGETEVALTGSGDCGYVAFFNDNEKIIQLGDPEEEDGEGNAYPKSQTLANHTFKTAYAWGTAAKNKLAVNKGRTSSDFYVQTGSLGMSKATSASSVTTVKTSNTPTTQILKKSAVWNDPFDDPRFTYVLSVAATNRTADSVKLTFTLQTIMGRYQELFGRGYGLQGHIEIKDNASAAYYAFGKWDIKQQKERWINDVGSGKKIITSNTTLTVKGLSSSQTSIKNITFKVTRNDDNRLLQAGGFPTGTSACTLAQTKCSNIPISTYVSKTVTTGSDTYYLSPASYGSGTNQHGPSITRVIPKDASGEVGAKNFTLTYSHKLSIGSGKNDTNQCGAFQLILTSGSGDSKKILAGLTIYKQSAGKKAKLRFYCNSKTVLTMDVDLSYNNKYFRSSTTTTVTKSGKTITFNVGGIKKSFSDSEIASVAVNEVTFTMTQYKTKTPLKYNGIYSIKFVKNNCETWREILNKFSANDVVEAECSTGEIRLNGVSEPKLGALGNDWEEFYLTPGINQIGISYSDWVTADYAPRLKVKYREVYL